jgi:hypothetical protein
MYAEQNSMTLIPRRPKTPPLGAFFALPLFLLPAGAWLVESDVLRLAKCSFKTFVGIPCMGCGATRATLNLLHGDISQAIFFSPMVAVGYFVLLAWGLLSAWLYVTEQELIVRTTKLSTWTLRIVLISLPFANWAYLMARGI